LQQQVVGSSFRAAYEEASSFVSVSDTARVEFGGRPLAQAGRVLDFGCGWGRISRILLTKIPRERLYSVDVDPAMIAIVNATLPGLNTMAVSPSPPTIAADDTFDSVFAFSVFSHLSEEAHREWAAEFGRIVQPAGFAFVTVLDSIFFGKIRGAQKAVQSGQGDDFSRSFSTLVEDVDAAQRIYDGGGFVYAGSGGGGVLSGDFYGWAAASPDFVTRTWGDAGFDVVKWVPSQVLFDQALVVLRRRPAGVPASRPAIPGKRSIVDRILGRS
jgi:SAM-dependent methyltransferase